MQSEMIIYTVATSAQKKKNQKNPTKKQTQKEKQT